MLHDDIAAHITGASGQRYLAFEQAIEMVGDPKRTFDVLLNDQNADATRLDLRNERVEFVDHERRQAEADLVAQEKPRIGQKSAPERNHLLLAARKRSGLLPPTVFEHRKQ